MKRNIGKVLVLIMLLGIFTLTACGKKKVETNTKDYSGVYKSDDSSEVVIEKEGDNYSVNISIFRLALFYGCSVDDIKDDVLYISGIDPNEQPIKFTFNYNTKVLTVTETTWNLLNVDDTFEFNK